MLALIFCVALMLIWTFATRPREDRAPRRVPIRVRDERDPTRRRPRG